MTVRFTIPLGAFSINKMQTRDARFKTAAYKDYATKFLYHLSNVPELQQLKKAWDGKATFFVQIVTYYPGHIFYNKQGIISSKTVDCSNFSKPILDLIFGDTLEINDKFVTKLVEEKRAGSDYSLEITIILTSSAIHR